MSERKGEPRAHSQNGRAIEDDVDMASDSEQPRPTPKRPKALSAEEHFELARQGRTRSGDATAEQEVQ